MRKAWFLILLLPLLMAGQCSPGSRVTCPALKNYPAEFQAEVAKELRIIIDTSPHVVEMLNDYGVTRNAIRACIDKRK